MARRSLEEEDMDKEYQAGDLTDILRAACSSSGEWPFPTTGFDHHEPTSSLPLGFGNPFCNTRDPLAFFVPPATSNQIITPTATAAAPGNHNLVASNIFSEISGGASVNSGDSVINANSSNSSAGQISSPRNPGVKRRKRQASKVVCIPAPALVNSRPTGEVVPSDLWAWRKYGQKPIKGSPHPRGYYRCSSSKGCSARKQVERSRTDPNMLVITYTSDHNHPWPTQRNALAGSTRKTTSTPSPSPMAKEEDSIDTSAVKEETDQDTLNPQFDVDTEINGLMPISSSQLTCEDSFFAELGEIEADMLFTKAFTPSDDHHLLKDQKTEGSDDLFDWSEENKGL